MSDPVDCVRRDQRRGQGRCLRAQTSEVEVMPSEKKTSSDETDITKL